MSGKADKPALSEFSDWQKREGELVGQIHRLERDLGKIKRSKAEYMATLTQAVTDAFATFSLDPIKPPTKDKRRRMGEVAVPMLSDTQLGKVTAEGDHLHYTSEIAVERVRTYAQKIADLTEIQRQAHPVDHCVTPLLGDIVEGEDIFPGQVHLIDSGLYRQIVISAEMLVDYLRSLLETYQTVTAHGVIGNHGRVGRKGVYDPETNMDRLVYWIARMALRDEPRLSWVLPEGRYERNWYSIVEIGKYRALAVHGDQFKGTLGMPWYGFAKKINAWAAGVIPCCPERPKCDHRVPFGDVFLGHWHQAALIPLNKRNVYVNGSTESYNTFAQENLAAMSDPSQWLLFVHPEKARVTASYVVHLTD